MKLDMFLDMLSEVELSQHIFGMLDEDEKLLKQFEIVNLINRGLSDIHMRFLIKKGELLLNVDSSQYRYDITDEEHTLTADFPANIIRILEVWDECGNKMELNTIYRSMADYRDLVGSVQMVDKQTLTFFNCCGCYRIIYQKGAELIVKPLEVKDFKPSKVYLDISMEYLDALIYYVCSRLFSVIPPSEGYNAQYSPGMLYSRKYEEECQRLRDLNFEIDGMGDSTQRFRDSMFP